MQLLKSSWKLGRFRGVEIRLHISLLLVIPLIIIWFHPVSIADWLWAPVTLSRSVA